MVAEAKLEITGDNAKLLAALTEAKAAVTEGFAQMKEAAAGLRETFEGISKAAVAFTAILAGGKAFKEAVAASIEAATGATALGKALGITATQASQLKVAMDENFVSSDAMTTASAKIAMTLKKNESAFTDMGIATRDANGNFRSTQDIMLDLNEHLGQFKEGTDRNVEGTKIYGRQWAAVSQTLRLSKEAIEEARQKADALGLTVGVEGKAKVDAYRHAMADVSTVMEALKKAVGDALMPVLTSMGQWFAENGPQAISVMRAAIYSVYAAFSLLRAAGAVAAEFLAGKINVLVADVQRDMAVIGKLLKLDWTGAKQAWAEGTANIAAKTAEMRMRMKAVWDDAQKDRDKFLEGQDQKQTAIKGKDGLAATTDEDKKSRVPVWEDELKEKAIAFQEDAAKQGQLREFSKQQEIQFWRDILSTTTTSLEERKAIRSKIASEELQVDKQRLEGSLANLKNEADTHGKNLAARLTAEQAYADQVAQVYGRDSKQYAQAQKQMIATKRAIIEQERTLDGLRTKAAQDSALRDVEIEENAAQRNFELGTVSQQKLLQLQQQFEAEKYAIKQEALARELTLINPDDDPVAYQQRMLQIEQLAQQHAVTMAKIQGKDITTQQSLVKNLQQTMTQGFAQAFAGIVKGTESVGQAFRNIFSAILNTVITTLSQIAAKYVTEHLLTMAQNKEEAGSNAAVAATGGAKSAASIPYIGWLLAIGAAASIFAAASGYKAEGGFDVPAGLSPQTTLHPKEMVLPAKFADPLRDMLESGNGRGRGGGAGDTHFHIKTNDSRSFLKQMKHNGTLRKALQDLHSRGGRFGNR